MSEEEKRRIIYVKDGLPENRPTSRLPASFWEELGRTVATFGQLEDVAKKAILAVTGTRPVLSEDPKKAVDDWYILLKRTVSDPLGRLIQTYQNHIKDHPEIAIENLEDLLSDLKKIGKARNAICHGAWGVPDEHGASIPIFTDQSGKRWTDPIDETYLKNLRATVTGLILGVMNSVTSMGYQFPGTNGPGKPVWPNNPKAAGID